MKKFSQISGNRQTPTNSVESLSKIAQLTSVQQAATRIQIQTLLIFTLRGFSNKLVRANCDGISTDVSQVWPTFLTFANFFPVGSVALIRLKVKLDCALATYRETAVGCITKAECGAAKGCVTTPGFGLAAEFSTATGFVTTLNCTKMAKRMLANDFRGADNLTTLTLKITP